MKSADIAVHDGVAHIIITCDCGSQTMKDRRGGLVDMSSASIPASDARSVKRYCVCATCGRAYRILVFCDDRIDVSSLDDGEYLGP